MTVSVPVFQIHCDEPECSDVVTLALMDTPYDGVFERHAVTQRYSFWGGETLPDGKHRCAKCRARLGTQESTDSVQERIEAIRMASGPFMDIQTVIENARSYRAMELDGTPRLWRGKSLQDHASRLDETLEIIESKNAE